MTGLSDLLSKANGGRLSARGLARAAQERGYTLNHDTAARYLRGDHGRPDEVTLVALAEVLGVPLSKLRAAAKLPHDITEPYSPPPEASRLSRRQRLAVDELIRAMLDPGRATAAGRTPPDVTVLGAQKANRPGGRRAARHGEPEKTSD